jgi:hypothetical protein
VVVVAAVATAAVVVVAAAQVAVAAGKSKRSRQRMSMQRTKTPALQPEFFHRLRMTFPTGSAARILAKSSWILSHHLRPPDVWPQSRQELAHALQNHHVRRWFVGSQRSHHPVHRR